MQENIVVALNHVRMVWAHRWLALGAAFTLCIGGWLFVLAMPNQFEATTKVFLDTRSILKPLLRGLAVDTSMRQDSAMLARRTLLSRPNLESVARKTDMDLGVKTPKDFERLVKGLASDVRITGTERDNIFVIQYPNSNPKLASRVVETLLNIFVEGSLGESRKDTSKTKQFIDGQIKDYEQKLLSAETRLKDFKQRNVGLMPGEGENYFQQRKTMAGVLSEARLQLTEAVQRRNTLRRELRGEEPTFGLGPQQIQRTPPPSPLDARISALEANLDQLLLQYTEQHPDVVSTRRILDEIKKERESELEQYVAQEQGGAPVPLNENPVFQNMKMAVSEAQANVAALTARVREYEAREAKLNKLMDTVPQIEAEFSRLNRDHGVNKRNYEELVKRRQSLQLSDDATQTGDNVKFRIIEPPRVPIIPVGPDRPMLSAAVLILGLGVRAGLAWLVAMVRPAVFTREGFSEFSDLPVLGTVSRIWTPQELVKRRVQHITFVAGFIVLIGAFSGLVALETFNPELVTRISNMGQRLL